MRSGSIDYNFYLLVSAILLFPCSIVVTILGIICFVKPHVLLGVVLENKVKVESNACIYNGLHLCQVGYNLDGLDLQYWLGYIGLDMCLVGLLLMAQSVFTYIGVRTKYRQILYIMLAMLVASIAVDYLAMHTAAAPVPEKYKEAKSMVEAGYLKDQYTMTGRKETRFVLSYNLLMMQLKCCGILSYEDLISSKMKVTDNSGITHSIKYPPACCDFSHRPINGTSLDDFRFLLDCQTIMQDFDTKSDGWDTNLEGCYTRIHSIINERHGSFALGFLMCLILLQAVQAIFRADDFFWWIWRLDGTPSKDTGTVLTDWSRQGKFYGANKPLSQRIPRHASTDRIIRS